MAPARAGFWHFPHTRISQTGFPRGPGFHGVVADHCRNVLPACFSTRTQASPALPVTLGGLSSALLKGHLR